MMSWEDPSGRDWCRDSTTTHIRFLLSRNEPASLRPVCAQLPPGLPLAQGLRPGRHLPPRRVPLEARPGRALPSHLAPHPGSPLCRGGRHAPVMTAATRHLKVLLTCWVWEKLAQGDTQHLKVKIGTAALETTWGWEGHACQVGPGICQQICRRVSCPFAPH